MSNLKVARVARSKKHPRHSTGTLPQRCWQERLLLEQDLPFLYSDVDNPELCYWMRFTEILEWMLANPRNQTVKDTVTDWHEVLTDPRDSARSRATFYRDWARKTIQAIRRDANKVNKVAPRSRQLAPMPIHHLFDPMKYA